MQLLGQKEQGVQGTIFCIFVRHKIQENGLQEDQI